MLLSSRPSTEFTGNRPARQPTLRLAAGDRLPQLELRLFDAWAPPDSTVQSEELHTHPELAPIMGGPEYDAAGNLVAESTPPVSSPPSELAKVSLPRYRVAPPDILIIQAVRLFPKDPYYIQTSDFLQIVVPGAPIDQPIAGTFQVDSGGRVNLGAAYDSVPLAGLTLGRSPRGDRQTTFAADRQRPGLGVPAAGVRCPAGGRRAPDRPGRLHQS